MASCTYELECWGEFQIRAIEGIGYPKSSPLAWLIENHTEVKHRVSRLPAGICTKGFEEYLLVERALNAYRYRLKKIHAEVCRIYNL